jgi:hypothetical protein
MGAPVEYTFLTWAEWRQRLEEASAVTEKLLELLTPADGRPALAKGPGEAVLACMLAARAICLATPRLPPFEWYFRRVAELVGMSVVDGSGLKGPPS